MFKIFLKYIWQRFLRYFQTRRSAKIITAGLFFLLFLAIGVGVYLFFKEGFYFISLDPFFREAFSLYVYEMYLLVFVSLVVFSTFVSSLFSLFRKKKDDWILSSPGFAVLPALIFFKVFLSALWPFFVIVLPALLAIKKVFELGVLGFFLTFLSAIFLEAMIVLIVLISALLIAKAMLFVSTKIIHFSFSYKKFSFVFLVFMFGMLFAAWQGSVDKDIIALFRAEDLTATRSSVDMISDNFKYLPSHIAAAAIYSWQSGNIVYTAYNLLALVVLVLILFFLWRKSSGWFLDVWKALQEGGNIAKSGTERVRSAGRTARFPANTIGILIKKELIIFTRDMRSLLWVAFLFFVWFLQAALNSMLSKNMLKYGLELSDLPNMVIVLQFVTGVYFISAFVLRFVFPTFGSERDSAWLLATAPIEFAKLFWAKLYFFAGLFTLLSLVVVGVNFSYFGVSLYSLGSSLFIFVTSVVFVVVYGLALGAMFPNFETNDPSALSTSLPGLSFMAGSLLYGALGGFLLYTAYIGNAFWWAVLFEVLSLMGIVVLARTASRKVGQAEFVKVRT